MNFKRIFASLFCVTFIFSTCYSADPIERERQLHPVKWWMYETLNDAAMTGMLQGPEHVLSHFVDKTVTNFANSTVHSIVGAKTKHHQDLISWGIGAVRNGIQCPKNSGWFSKFLLLGLLPAFTERTITKLASYGITKTLNLHYPQFLLNHPTVYFFVAPWVHMFSKLFLNGGYHLFLHYMQNHNAQPTPPNVSFQQSIPVEPVN